MTWDLFDSHFPGRDGFSRWKLGLDFQYKDIAEVFLPDRTSRFIRSWFIKGSHFLRRLKFIGNSPSTSGSVYILNDPPWISELETCHRSQYNRMIEATPLRNIDSRSFNKRVCNPYNTNGAEYSLPPTSGDRDSRTPLQLWKLEYYCSIRAVYGFKQVRYDFAISWLIPPWPWGKADITIEEFMGKSVAWRHIGRARYIKKHSNDFRMMCNDYDDSIIWLRRLRKIPEIPSHELSKLWDTSISHRHIYRFSGHSVSPRPLEKLEDKRTYGFILRTWTRENELSGEPQLPGIFGQIYP